MALLLGVSAWLPSAAAAAPQGLHLTVYPDGSVNVALDLSKSVMLPSGTEPTVTSSERATTSGGWTTITLTMTESLPSDLLNQAPFNYSVSMSSSGSDSNGISKGSIVVQAVPGVWSPGASFRANYNGDSNSVSASGNTTLQYGTYGSGQDRVVLNATTISQDLQLLQSEGLNASNIRSLLAQANASFPQGNFSLRSFLLNATYGIESATVYGGIHLTGNMTLLPSLVAGFYLGLFGSFTRTAEISTTAVSCNPQAPAACAVTLENSGTASTSVNGCSLNETAVRGNNIGTVSPNNPTVPAEGSVQVTCTLPANISAGPNGSYVLGWFDLSDGEAVPFTGTWNSSAVISMSTTTSTSTESTSTPPLSQSFLDLFSAFSKVTSSYHEYTYTASYASGIMEVSETLVAAQNLNLDQAMPLFAKYAANQSAPSYVTQFLNSTRVDISSFSANVSEVQKASGEFDTNISVAGVTIYPQIVKSGGVFNESGLFKALEALSTNVTVTGGTSADGSVRVIVPVGVPPPTSSTAGSMGWNGVNMSQLAGLELTVSQASTTSTTSSTSTTGGGGIPEFPVQLGFTLLATVVIVASYLFARRGLRIGKQAPL